MLVSATLQGLINQELISGGICREKGHYKYAGQWKHSRMHGCGVYELNGRQTWVIILKLRQAILYHRHPLLAPELINTAGTRLL